MQSKHVLPLLMVSMFACSSTDEAAREWTPSANPEGGDGSIAQGGEGGAAGSSGDGGVADASAGGQAGQGGSAGGLSGHGGSAGLDCNAGLGNCDGDSSNGCETNLATSASHCGQCAHACPTAAHAMPACKAGSCTFECMPTHGDCDGEASNGCEAVYGNDVQNCGECGNICSADGGTPMCTGGVCGVCPVIQFTVDTQQACALSLQQGFQLDAEAFITVGGQQHRVFALDRWGAGHVIAWCDATTTHTLLAAFNVLGYLGQVSAPKVASFGDSYLCDPASGVSQLPSTITYLGQDMPALYVGDPVKLAADWDVILFCGFRIPWAHAWDAELDAFVSVHGKGLLAIMDYEGIVTVPDFTKMTAITDGDGIVFEPLNLPWAPASTNVVLDCVPDLDK